MCEGADSTECGSTDKVLSPSSDAFDSLDTLANEAYGVELQGRKISTYVNILEDIRTMHSQ